MKLNVDVEKQIAQFNFENLVRARKKPVSRFVIGSVLIHLLSASAIHELGQIPQPKDKQEIVEIDFSTAPIADAESASQPAPKVEEAAPLLTTQSTPVQNPIPVPVATPFPVSTPVQNSSQVRTQTEPSPILVAPTAVTSKQEKKSSSTPETKASLASHSESTIPKEESMTPSVPSKDQTAKNAKPAPVWVQDSRPLKAPEPVVTSRAQAVTPTFEDSDVPTNLQKSYPDFSPKTEVSKQPQVSNEDTQAEKAALLEQDLDQQTSAAAAALDDKLKEAEAAAHAENSALASQAETRLAALKSEQPPMASNSSPENGAGQLNQSSGPGQKGELRTLDQLRQMPGNPKPNYSHEERLQGQQGAVIFKAFVTTEGQLTSFELLQSTGHRNLDFKTLRALKQWKFYPGQQGWVELPFKWDLKGGPQEMPTLLRRRVSQQN